METKFSGKFTYALSLIGYSVGISDFWKFPYVVYRNGGGAFLIPFVLTMLVCGVPLYCLEVSISQFSGRGPYSIWAMSPFFKGIGITQGLLNAVFLVNGLMVRIWALFYLVNSFGGSLPWVSCSNSWNTNNCISFETSLIGKHEVTNSSDNLSSSNITLKYRFNSTVGISHNSTVDIENSTDKFEMTAAEEFWQFNILNLSSGIGVFGSLSWKVLLASLVLRVIIGLSVIKSIKSVEKVMVVFAFIPVITLLCIWIRCLTLPGSATGMLYYIRPDLTKLASARVWLEAAFMSFYTLGPGYGPLILMGSHSNFKQDCLHTSVLTVICDILWAVFAGLVCFSILGVMAEQIGVPLEKTVSSGLALGFVVYPTALNYLPFPQIWAVLFFVGFLTVGLDGLIFGLEFIIHIIDEIFFRAKMSFKRRLIFICVISAITFIVSIIYCGQSGGYIFHIIDWYAFSWTIAATGLVEIIAFVWIYGGDRICIDLEYMLGRKLNPFLRLTGAFAAPAIIMLILVVSFSSFKPPTYGSYKYPAAAEACAWILVLTLVVPIFLFPLVAGLRMKRNLKENLVTLLLPDAFWGPAKGIDRTSYDRTVYKVNRSFLNIAWYNLTGKFRHRAGSSEHVDHETVELT